MKANLKCVAPLIVAGAAAAAIVAAPIAAAESFAVATGASSITIPASPGGDGCLYGACGHGDASGGGGCTVAGICGSGGFWGGEGCVPFAGCFNWHQ